MDLAALTEPQTVFEGAGAGAGEWLEGLGVSWGSFEGWAEVDGRLGFTGNLGFLTGKGLVFKFGVHFVHQTHLWLLQI